MQEVPIQRPAALSPNWADQASVGRRPENGVMGSYGASPGRFRARRFWAISGQATVRGGRPSRQSLTGRCRVR